MGSTPFSSYSSTIAPKSAIKSQMLAKRISAPAIHPFYLSQRGTFSVKKDKDVLKCPVLLILQFHCMQMTELHLNHYSPTINSSPHTSAFLAGFYRVLFWLGLLKRLKSLLVLHWKMQPQGIVYWEVVKWNSSWETGQVFAEGVIWPFGIHQRKKSHTLSSECLGWIVVRATW